MKVPQNHGPILVRESYALSVLHVVHHDLREFVFTFAVNGSRARLRLSVYDTNVGSRPKLIVTGQ